MKRLSIVLALFFGLISAIGVRAQNNLPGGWKIYDRYNTIIHSESPGGYDIDNQGNLWLFKKGTGLIKYTPDGVATVYSSAFSQLQGYCRKLVHNNKTNTVWIIESGLIDSRVSVYDFSNTYVFENLKQYTTSSCDFIQDFAVDSLGRMWFALYGGLVKYDNGNWTIFNTDNSSLPDNNIRRVLVDSGNNIWCSTSDAIIKYNGSSWQIFSNILPFISFLVIQENEIWATSGNFYDNTAVVKFNGGSWDTLNLPPRPEHVWAISGIAFTDNNLYLFTDNGLFLYDGLNWEYLNHLNLTLPISDPSYLVDTSRVMNFEAVKVSPDGRIFVTCVNNLLEYIPDGLSSPTSPTNLTAVVVDSVVNLTWDSSPTPNVSYFIMVEEYDNTLYAQYQSEVRGFYSQTDSVTDDNSSGKERLYFIYAEKDRQRSEPIMITVNNIDPPHDLSVEIQGTNNVLSWQPSNTSDVTYYLYKRYSEDDSITGKSSSWSYPIADNFTSLSYVDTDIDQYDNCYYKVLAFKNGQLSNTNLSNEVFAKRSIRPPVLQSATAQADGNRVQWQWEDNWSWPEPTYAVYRKEVGGQYQKIADSLEFWLNEYFDMAADLSKNYYYAITKTKDSTESDFSNEILVQGYLAPGDISINLVDGEDKGYQINWTANTVSQLLYNVYRREQGTTSDVMVAQLSANSTGYTDVLSGAALDKEYYYYIKPQLGTNEGTGKSNEVSTTSCKPPLTLTWSKSTGTLNQLPVGEKIKYSFTITNNDNQAVSDVSVMVSDGTACLLDVPENTNNNGETNYIFDIPRDRTVSEYTRNFTFTKWPYNKLTQNTTITVDQTIEVWDNGFRPETDGFKFGNFGNLGNCFGFSLDSLLKYWNPSTISSILDSVDVDTTARVDGDFNSRYIIGCQNIEFSSWYSAMELIDKIKSYETSVQQIIEGFQSSDRGDLRFIIFEADPNIKHAVVPYRIIKKYDPSNLSEVLADTIYVYDCNRPYTSGWLLQSIVKIVISDNEWKMICYNESNNLYDFINNDRSNNLWATWKIQNLYDVPAQKTTINNENLELNKKIIVCPNPANDKLQVMFQNDINQKAKILLCNNLGLIAKYLSSDEQISIGEFSKVFDISDIPTGYYFLRIIMENCEISQPVVIIK